MLADELLDRRSKNFKEMEHSLGLKGLLFQENSNSKSGAEFAIISFCKGLFLFRQAC